PRQSLRERSPCQQLIRDTTAFNPARIPAPTSAPRTTKRTAQLTTPPRVQQVVRRGHARAVTRKLTNDFDQFDRIKKAHGARNFRAPGAGMPSSEAHLINSISR